VAAVLRRGVLLARPAVKHGVAAARAARTELGRHRLGKLLVENPQANRPRVTARHVRPSATRRWPSSPARRRPRPETRHRRIELWSSPAAPAWPAPAI